VILEAEMPPAAYVVMHPEAALDFYQKMSLIDGLEASLGDFEDEDEREDRDDDEREERDDDD
jgi:hypothetical protein